MAGAGLRFWKHPDRVATILVEAELHGDEYAARRHNLCTRTLIRWRRRFMYDPDVSAAVQEKRGELTQDFMERAKRARDIVLSRITEVAQQSKDPRALADALKAIQLAVGQEEMIAAGLFHIGNDEDASHGGAVAQLAAGARPIQESAHSGRLADAVDVTEGGGSE